MVGFWGGDVEGKRQEPRVGPSDKGKAAVGNGAKGRATVGAGRWVSLAMARAIESVRQQTSFPRTGLNGYGCSTLLGRRHSLNIHGICYMGEDVICKYGN